MAIFNLYHNFIGRSPHSAGAASLYSRDTTGQDRCTEIISERMPDECSSLMKWLHQEEQGDRKDERWSSSSVVKKPSKRRLERRRWKSFLSSVLGGWGLIGGADSSPHSSPKF